MWINRTSDLAYYEPLVLIDPRCGKLLSEYNSRAFLKLQTSWGWYSIWVTARSRISGEKREVWVNWIERNLNGNVKMISHKCCAVRNRQWRAQFDSTGNLAEISSLKASQLHQQALTLSTNTWSSCVGFWVNTLRCTRNWYQKTTTFHYIDSLSKTKTNALLIKWSYNPVFSRWLDSCHGLDTWWNEEEKPHFSDLDNRDSVSLSTEITLRHATLSPSISLGGILNPLCYALLPLRGPRLSPPTPSTPTTPTTPGGPSLNLVCGNFTMNRPALVSAWPRYPLSCQLYHARWPPSIQYISIMLP